MDLIQVTAYPAFGKLMVQCTTAVTSESARSWTHRILEEIDVPPDLGDDWDLIWLVGQTLCERAVLLSRDDPFKGPRSV